MIIDGLHDNSFKAFTCAKILDVLVPVYDAKGIRVPFVDSSNSEGTVSSSFIDFWYYSRSIFL